MPDTHALDTLIQSLRRLPGVGVRSAQRMAFHLLQHDREGAQVLARAQWRTCATCADPRRDASKLCVVETPADQAAMERTAAFKGRYFVLMGKLSPLDGIGPREIGVQKLIERATDGVVQEVILATNFTAEGEATAHVIGQALKSRGLTVTRLARGVPAGSELEYVDLGTIAHALVDRR